LSRRSRLSCLILVAILPLASFAAPPPAADKPMQQLIVDFEAYNAAEDPFSAGQNGDKAALSKLPDVSPAGDARRKAALTRFQQRLAAVKPGALSPEAKLNHDLLEREVRERLADLSFDTARSPSLNDSGFETALPEAATTIAIRSQADAEAWIRRLEAAPGYWRDNMANIRRGIRTGFVQPKIIAKLIADRARHQADTPIDEDPMLAPLKSLPPAISAPMAADLLGRGREALQALRPIQAEYADLMEKDYLPAARESLGARSLPDGANYYAWLVRFHTTTTLTPDEVHEIGKSEVTRIRQEMEKLIKDTGFTGSFADFQAMLRSDPRFYVSTRQALLEKASEIAKRIDDQLPRHFGRLPRLTYGVRPVPAEIEENYTTGRYFEGSPSLGVAGGLMINTSHLDQRPLYELPALALHEGVPGHHLQIALAQELDDVPAFRRDAYVTAFVEGWGLYAEQLGDELGIYRDNYERFGKLSYEMWRACRLVADTGIHWKGWSIEQARACFTDNTALSPTNIQNELMRYVSWPGQALAYKIGELKLMELRHRAEKALGDKFDERAFHDRVLLAGPLPLDVLEARVDEWIAGQKH
jgi:uncharacterized protein (DUF885 family)